MIKPLLLISALLIVSNSVNSQSEPEQAKTDPESAAQIENTALPEDAPPSEDTLQYKNVDNYEDADIVCTRERKTGSRIYTKVCRTKRQIEGDRDDGAEFINRARSQSHPKTVGGAD